MRAVSNDRIDLDKKVALFERMQHHSQDDALYEKGRGSPKPIIDIRLCWNVFI